MNRRSLRSRAPALVAAWLLALALPARGAGAATVTRGPYLQAGAWDRITVRWRTDVPTDSRVWLGPTPSALQPAADQPALTTEHEVEVDRLTPQATWFYAVGSTQQPLAGGDSTYRFTTAPLPGSPTHVRAWILGDSGQPGAALDRVRDAYLAFAGGAATDAWLMLGDNAYNSGTDAEYQAAVFDPFRGFLRAHVLWPTRGNHDTLIGGADNDYYELFTLPAAGQSGGLPSGTEAWYAFDIGPVHFVCLDSEGSDRSPGGAMLTWLDQDLAATHQPWIVAFWHHPPYTKGSHDSDNDADSGGRMRDMRQNALPVLEAHGVDLVLTGHSHSYERSFLLDGHYGTSGTLAPGMVLDGGDGQRDGDGAYVKPAARGAPHAGAVYAVAGSSSKTSGGSLDHPVMVRSLDVLGSLVLDVAADALDGTFLDDQGTVRDRFAIDKPEAVAAGGGADAGVGPRLVLGAARPSPATAATVLDYELPAAGRASLDIVDAAGRLVRGLVRGWHEAGPARASWDGRDRHGRAAASGAYFAVLRFAGERRVSRIVLAR